MKVLGVVVEYNPFHNGHLYHIEQSKKLTGCDPVVCVMSGNFIQRGEPAIINKFARTEIALQSGIDLVIELPVVFAMSSAEYFAYGAVKLLDSIGIVNCISFGSEQGNVEDLKIIADILSNEPDEFRELLSQELTSGLSFPTCRQNALEKYIFQKGIIDENFDVDRREISGFSAANKNISQLHSVIETSNNILAIEYLKALNRLESNILPYTIKRVANSYNTSNLSGNISSATAIRNNIFQSARGTYSPHSEAYLSDDTVMAIPPATRILFEREYVLGQGPIHSSEYGDIILAMLRKMSPVQIKELPGVSEGLEYRIKSASEMSSCFDELVNNICTKRYTRTRIQRILFSLLTGMAQRDLDTFMAFGGPQYVHVLGFNSVGRQLLSNMKKVATLPIATKLSSLKKSCNPLINRMIEIEATSTDMYVLGYKNTANRKGGQEFTQNVIRVLD